MSAYVYRCRDHQNRVLYIGCTNNLAVRFRAHERTGQPWLPYLAWVEWDHYEDEREARIDERLAIMAERPRFNVKDNYPLTGPKRAPFPDAVPLASLLSATARGGAA